MKKPSETAERGIGAFFYQISYIELESDASSALESHYDRVQLLGELGFKVPVEGMKRYDTIDEVIRFCEQWEEKREEYAYEIDGMVVKVDQINLQENRSEERRVGKECRDW